MRINKQFIKSIALATLLFAGYAVSSVAQDTTTIVNPETKAPVILSTSPASGEANVDLSSVIKITFSSEMDERTINNTTLQLHVSSDETMYEMHDEMMIDHKREKPAIKESKNNRDRNKGVVKGTVSYSDKVAVFTPAEDLKEGAQYTFIVSKGVYSTENIALENDEKWSFTVSDKSDSAYFDSDKQDGKHDMDRSEYGERGTDVSQNDEVNMIQLGKAGHFVILAKENVSNESGSEITGHIGEGSVADKLKNEKEYTDSARQRITGPVLVLQSNERDTTDTDVNEALEDMMTAYRDASIQNGNGDTNQKVESFDCSLMSAGIHEWNESLHIKSDVTLSGSADDVWLFKVGNNLTVHENTVFTLANGARAENIFWYVEGEVNIGNNAHFEGIILSMNEITLEEGAKLNGRLFSQTSISLDDNIITEPGSMAGRTSSSIR